jgi:hypothetical protein
MACTKISPLSNLLSKNSHRKRLIQPSRFQALHLLRVHKETAAFANFYWHKLRDGLEAFEYLRVLHDLKKIAEAALRVTIMDKKISVDQSRPLRKWQFSRAVLIVRSLAAAKKQTFE